MAMDAKIGRFFDAVGSFFSGGENIPWCDRDVIAVRGEPIHFNLSSPSVDDDPSGLLVLSQFCWLWFKQNACASFHPCA